MKGTREGQVLPLIGLSSLIFIYVLLGILGILFAATYFGNVLREGGLPLAFVYGVFLSILLILIALIIGLAVRLFRDLRDRRVGIRLRWQLLRYFVMIVIFSSLPPAIISVVFLRQTIRSWYSAELSSTVQDARWFAMDAYRNRLKILEFLSEDPALDEALRLARSEKTRAAVEYLRRLDSSLLAVQEFEQRGGAWLETVFIGSRPYRMDAPGPGGDGFLARDVINAPNIVRRQVGLAEGRIRVVSYHLGEDFDLRMERLELSNERMAVIERLRPTLVPVLLNVYLVFGLPSLLMALIIAYLVSGRIIRPLVNLDSATRRVATGDFSVRVFAHPGDELGMLVQSFNAMLSDLEESRGKTLRAEKFNLWQDMAQRLAHEIKNPLTPIKLSAERLLRRWQNDPAAVGEIMDGALGAIIHEVDGLNALLTDFRAYSRLPAPTKSPVELVELVNEAVSPYRSSYPDVDFRLDGLEAGTILPLDRRLMTQVLANLLLNAVAAMDGHGLIEFRSDLVKKRDSRYCRISIRDSGIGIPEKNRSQIFTPYFTTKAEGGGLGLSIVERIVNDHGGEIWFDSAEGLGTVFYIDLPDGRGMNE